MVAGVVARGAAAAARLAAQGAKSGAKGLGKGAKKAAVGAKDMAVDAGKEKLISVAQDKAADAAKKRGELKAQSYSDTDLEEGKAIEATKTALRVAGLAPGVGIAPDAAAGAITLAQRAAAKDPERKKKLNRELAGDALAMIPGAGQATRGAQVAAKAGKLIKGTKKAGGGSKLRGRAGAATRKHGAKVYAAGEQAVVNKLRGAKAQSYSDTDLEEGKIMNKYVRTLSEAKKPKEERMPVGKSKYGPVTISTRKTPSGSKGQGNGRTTQDMQLDADPTRPNKNAQAALKQRLKTNQNIRKHSGPHDGTPSEVATGKGNKARKRVLKKVLAMESDVYFRLGHIFLEAFAGPTASKYGDSRSSAGIKDPQVKADAKKAKTRMDKKLGVKTNPRAKDVVQAAMNTRRRAARRGETPAGSIDNLKR